jgi:hypothetical protein
VQLAKLVISSMEKNQRASKSSPDLTRVVRIKVQDAKHRNEQTPQVRVDHACHSDSSSRTAAKARTQ